MHLRAFEGVGGGEGGGGRGDGHGVHIAIKLCMMSCMEFRTCEMLFGRALLLIPFDSYSGGGVLLADICVSKMFMLV